MLRTLRRQGVKVIPSNSRVRRRRTSSPPQGPPASRPVGGLRTLRILRGHVSASSGSAPPTCGNAARDFRLVARIRINEVFVGAKCNHAYRQCSARVRSPQGASVQCKQSSALRSSAAGSFQAVTPLPPQAPSEESRPSTPRYGFAVFIPACYSSIPLPGRIPPEVFRAGRGQPFRLLAQTVSGLTATSLLPSFQQWAVPAQAPEAVCPPTPSVFVGVWEPKVSQPLRRQSPPPPHSSRPPPGPRSTSFRALWHWQTHSRRTKPPPQPSRLRDCQHHRPTRRLTPQRQ